MLHLRIHPDNPQPRLISQAVERIRAGDVVVYPTDAAYAIGCQIGNKNAMERISQIRGLGQNINMLFCVAIYQILQLMPKSTMPCIAYLKAIPLR